MGADVMRWHVLRAGAEPEPEVRLRPGGEIKRRLLTLWNSVKFFVDYANIAGLSAQPGGESDQTLQPLDRWLLERTEQLVAEMTEAYERYWTPDVIASFESFVDDLSNWYIRRSRRRFWDGDEVALWTLWHALVRSRADDRAGDAVPRRLTSGARCARTTRPSRSSCSPGPRCVKRTTVCSPRSRRCGASSSSAARLAATQD